jgi:arylsulfatase
MLMSGTDHHLAGLGTMAELLTDAQRGQPGYEGYLNRQVLALPEVLRDAGYHTYMAGKWHLGLTVETGPKARGFESSFALLQGAGSHFAPVAGQETAADKSAQYREGDDLVALPADFYSSHTYTDKLIGYLRSHSGDGRPFFAYAAYTAPHWPLHVPDADIDRYRGRYDAGYDVIRAARIDRQKALGLLPADWTPNPGLPKTASLPGWSELSAEQKASEARKMEIYAAMVHVLDRDIGRLIQTLKDIGAYDNTLVFFQSDNGAEGAPSLLPVDANTDNSLANLGRRRSNVGVGARWAEVSATPFRLFKAYQAEGGIAAPAIVRLPRQTQGRAALTQVTRAMDLLPTFIAAAGIADPGTSYAGRSVHPITGVSLLPALDGHDAQLRPPGTVIAGELFGGRFVRRDQWKLVSVGAPAGDGRWQLYDLAADRGEVDDLSAANADIAAELTAAWDRYADEVGVVDSPIALPLGTP